MRNISQLLKSLDLPHDLICRIGGVSPNTMRSYFKEYIEGGSEKVQAINFYRPKSDLTTYTSSIETYLKENPPTSISQASSMIEQLTDIKRGITQTRNFLKSLGFSIRKAGAIPSKTMTEEKNGTAKIFGPRIDATS